MYCVVQELQLKKADTFGEYKGMTVFTNPFNQRDIPQYCYGDAGERFERPIKTAYKISIHESKRANGVVTKKQFIVTTVNYYTLATGWFLLGEYADKIATIAEKLNVDVGAIYDVIEKKIAPLQKHIQSEFELTEEYVVSTRKKEVIALYEKAKAEFSKKFNVPESEYDFCFNVFGKLMNEDYYKKIVDGAEERRSYQELLM